jgi:hypothetical protein
MRTITVIGGDLYRLALQYLGDATQWNRIAQTNSILDPVLVGTNILKVPDPNPLLTGGVYVR